MAFRFKDYFTLSIHFSHIMRSFMICTPQPTLLGCSNQEESDGWGMWHIWRTKQVYTGFWWENVIGRDHL
jgi:hypothetical protein